MRYFLFTYTGETEYKTCAGNITVVSEDFPSNNWLKKTASDQSGFSTANLIITGWNEFDNEEDYINFNQ